MAVIGVLRTLPGWMNGTQALAAYRKLWHCRVMKTRVSAYGLALSGEQILLTQLADFCYRPGHWTLPGGGMKHGELPEETLVREFHEETSLQARDLDLFHVHAFSESERGPFMGVQIVYRVAALGEPRVLEVGGSTADVAWVSFADLPKLPRVPGLDIILKKLGVMPSS